MDRFVKLTVVGKLGNETERIFNLRFVRAVDAEKRTLLLEGNKKPFVITEWSMKKLIAVCELEPNLCMRVVELETKVADLRMERILIQKKKTWWKKLF